MRTLKCFATLLLLSVALLNCAPKEESTGIVGNQLNHPVTAQYGNAQARDVFCAAFCPGATPTQCQEIHYQAFQVYLEMHYGVEVDDILLNICAGNPNICTDYDRMEAWTISYYHLN